MPTSSNVFRLAPATPPDPGRGRIRGWFRRVAERALALERCERIYRELASVKGSSAFLDAVMKRLGVRCTVAGDAERRIPRDGPCVVVANHPFGGLDAIVLSWFLRRVRPDVQVLANLMLTRIPQLSDLVIPVDPFGRPGAKSRNVAPLRRAVRWVRDGGMLLVFPAGAVSHLHVRGRVVTDPPWSASVGRLVRRCRAPVIPVHVPGANGRLFQMAGLVHPILRTLLLPRQLLNKQGRSLELRVGSVLEYEGNLSRFERDRELVDYLRLRTYLLDGRGSAPATVASPTAAALADPVPRDDLASELACLPARQRLVRSGVFEVWHAAATQIPRTLREIGRLRELTFRGVGEGTGRALDLDRFDHHYEHLFMWNAERREVVGAYRFGRTDRILARLGKRGLYTTTLFRFRTAFFRHIDPALELGRSFVRPEYQRSYSSLLLLWRGIGTWVARHPRYRILFGPVSISRDYTDLSRYLIAAALHPRPGDAFGPMVRPKNPLRMRRLRLPGCEHVGRVFGHDLEELSSLIAEVEADAKGIPVLLRHYLRLNGKLLAFNVDTDFADVLDGLVLVDLLQTDRKQLDRHLTRKGAEAFLAHHRPPLTTGCCA